MPECRWVEWPAYCCQYDGQVRFVLLLSVSCERTDPGGSGSTHMVAGGTKDAPDALELALMRTGRWDATKN
jgi:hypothetical protein